MTPDKNRRRNVCTGGRGEREVVAFPGRVYSWKLMKAAGGRFEKHGEVRGQRRAVQILGAAAEAAQVRTNVFFDVHERI